MTRNLKAFGLALVAVLAISAIGAQGASAAVEHSFRSAVSDTVLTGQNESYGTGNSKHVFSATPGLKVECDATFIGRNTGTTRDEVAIRPAYSNCGAGVTVHNNGCDYFFDSDTEQATGHSPSSEHARVSLNCEHKHYIEITANGCNLAFYDTQDNMEVNQELSGARYTQLSNHSGKHAVTVNATVKTIKYIATAGGFCGLVGHPAGTYTNGIYEGFATVTGYKFSTKTGGTSLTTGTTYSHSEQVDLTISTPT
jgi:hypothetical protein